MTANRSGLSSAHCRSHASFLSNCSSCPYVPSLPSLLSLLESKSKTLRILALSMMLSFVLSQFNLMWAGRWRMAYLFSRPMWGKEYLWIVPDSLATMRFFLEAVMAQIPSLILPALGLKFSIVWAGLAATCGDYRRANQAVLE